MKSAKEWLAVRENRQVIQSNDLTMFLNALDENTVAIKCSGVLHVTYSTCANVTTSDIKNIYSCASILYTKFILKGK